MAGVAPWRGAPQGSAGAARAADLAKQVPPVYQPAEDFDVSGRPTPAAQQAEAARARAPRKEGSPKSENRTDEPSLIGELILLLVKIAFVAGFAGMVLVFLFGLMQTADESMSPAVREGDLVVYYRLQKDYSAGDLVVVNNGERKEVRRVIAVAGDEVSFDEDGLVINGYHQSEERIFTETLPYADGITYPVVLADGQVFVMGDNRTQANDSRMYGPVDVESGTEGEVMTVIRRRNF